MVSKDKQILYGTHRAIRVTIPVISHLWNRYLRFTASGYPCGILDLRFLVTPFGILYLRFLVIPFSILDLRLLVDKQILYGTHRAIRVTIPVISHLWNRYSGTVKQLMMATDFRSDDFKLTSRKPWCGSFLVSSKEIMLASLLCL
jgi:hypothetical protein